MSIERAVERVLDRLSDGQVEALALLCETQTRPGEKLVEVVVGSSLANRDAVERLAASWSDLPSLGGPGVALALRVGLRARGIARTRRARPVWTGPGASGTQRLTSGVLHELVAGAQRQILLVSYAAYTLPALAADLTAAVARGCTVDVVFETEEDSAGEYSGPHATPFGTVAGIRRWRWPAGERPEGGAVLHAKLLVVDERRALVGSANLTSRALRGNLEAGVLIEDSDVAAPLDGHVRELMAAGVLVRAG